MTTLIELEVESLRPDQKKHYADCIRRGESPRMALMLASRFSPVMGGSDRAFNEGARRKMSNLPAVNQKMLEIARKAGINTNGKYHVSGLGAYNNPMAWVSTVDDVKESLKKQGLSSRGLVNYKAPEKPPAPRIALAEDIIQDELRQRLSQNERLKSMPPNSAAFSSAVRSEREKVIADHAPRAAKSGPNKSLGSRSLEHITGTR